MVLIRLKGKSKRRGVCEPCGLELEDWALLEIGSGLLLFFFSGDHQGQLVVFW